MNILSINTVNRKTFSIKTQTIAAFFAAAAAVVIPQIFHIMGAMSGLGTALGEVFLPMHLPVIFIGLLVGSYAGAVSGVLAPFISFLLTGMPLAQMLPFMMIELCTYGFVSGILRNRKMSVTGKVLFVQIAGRLVRAAAIFIAVNVFSRKGISVSSVWLSIPKGIFGICFQLVLIPLMLYRIENVSKND